VSLECIWSEKERDPSHFAVWPGTDPGTVGVLCPRVPHKQCASDSVALLAVQLAASLWLPLFASVLRCSMGFQRVAAGNGWKEAFEV
jgi:hypothetical protein